jgi:hypothetical protein
MQAGVGDRSSAAIGWAVIRADRLEGKSKGRKNQEKGTDMRCRMSRAKRIQSLQFSQQGPLDNKSGEEWLNC